MVESFASLAGGLHSTDCTPLITTLELASSRSLAFKTVVQELFKESPTFPSVGPCLQPESSPDVVDYMISSWSQLGDSSSRRESVDCKISLDAILGWRKSRGSGNIREQICKGMVIGQKTSCRTMRICSLGSTLLLRMEMAR